MVRISKEEIARRKLAGQAKREQRAKKKKALEAKLEDELPPGLKDSLESMALYLERVYQKKAVLTDEKVEELKNLLLPNETDIKRFKAYQKCIHEYEAIIFYAWEISEELCDLVFVFWDNVLSNPDAVFTGNSIIRIMGGRPKANLVKILETHKDKFEKELYFSRILKERAQKCLEVSGPYDFSSHCYGTWTQEEKDRWQKIERLF